MTITRLKDGYYVIDDDGYQIAGSFTSEHQAWRWIDDALNNDDDEGSD